MGYEQCERGYGEGAENFEAEKDDGLSERCLGVERRCWERVLEEGDVR